MAEFLIVGGGVIGLSIAYELSKHAAGIVIIDRGVPGREASWAGAGILPPANAENAQHPLEQLRGLSHQLHRQWASDLQSETGIDTGFRRCGGLYLASSTGEAALLAGMTGVFDEEGIQYHRWTANEVCEHEPALADFVQAGRLKAAYYLPGESQLRNPDHLKALAAACARRGVEIKANVAAQQFEISGGRLRQIITSDGPVDAGTVCVASGAWTGQLMNRFGLPNGILPIRGQMLMFHCGKKFFSRVLNVGPRYIVPRDDGRVLVGSSEEEAGFEKETTEPVLIELREFAYQLIPSLRQHPIEASWSGLRPGSFDSFPYLGKVPDVDNLFIAAGHFRSGLHLSPATAVVMSQLMRGETPQIDLTPFRIGRG